MLHPNLVRPLAACALLATSSSPTHSAVFTPDDRQYVGVDEGSPYAPIGVVKGGALIYHKATGFMVDDCHVLTSRAVVGDTSPIGLRVKFSAAIGTPHHVSSSGTVVAVGGNFQRGRPIAQQWDEAGRQWVLVRLKKCLGAQLGHVVLKSGPFSPYEFNNLQSAGYPVDRDGHRGISLDPACRVLFGFRGLWSNDCANAPANPGSPIFHMSTTGGKRRMEVYAMQSGGYVWNGPVTYRRGYENQAIAVSEILPSIAKFLTLRT